MKLYITKLYYFNISISTSYYCHFNVCWRYRDTIINKQFLLDVIDVNSIFVSYIHSIIYFVIGIIAFHKAIIYSKKTVS